MNWSGKRWRSSYSTNSQQLSSKYCGANNYQKFLQRKNTNNSKNENVDLKNNFQSYYVFIYLKFQIQTIFIILFFAFLGIWCSCRAETLADTWFQSKPGNEIMGFCSWSVNGCIWNEPLLSFPEVAWGNKEESSGD